MLAPDDVSDTTGTFASLCTSITIVTTIRQSIVHNERSTLVVIVVQSVTMSSVHTESRYASVDRIPGPLN